MPALEREEVVMMLEHSLQVNLSGPAIMISVGKSHSCSLIENGDILLGAPDHPVDLVMLIGKPHLLRV